MWTLPIKQKTFKHKMYLHDAVLSQFTAIHSVRKQRNMRGSLITLPFGVPENNLT